MADQSLDLIQIARQWVSASIAFFSGASNRPAGHMECLATSEILHKAIEALPERSEIIVWHPAEQKPDADTTVLLRVEDSDGTPWPAYMDGERWYYADSGAPIAAEPIEWAHLPKGSRHG